MNAQKLNQLAKEAKEAKLELDEENINFTINHFTKDLELYAKRGKFSRRTTCLLQRDNNTFHCQTENDGEGFEVKHIKQVIKRLEAQGFQVELERRKGYCPFTISWNCPKV